MPRCDGRPDAPCPGRKNDLTVKGTQGDLMLCPDCDEYRFPSGGVRSSKPKQLPSKSSGGNVGMSTRRDGRTTTTAVESPATGDAPVDQAPQLVVNEVLSYICHHRNSCSRAALLSVAGSFFTPAEIAGAKKCLLEQFLELSDTDLATERRSSTTRPAHEAELEDILGVIDLLDSSDKLKTVLFAAVNLSRLPGYGPEETNVCALADHQVKLRASVEQLVTKVEGIGMHFQGENLKTDYSSDVKQTVVLLDKKVDDICSKVDSLIQSSTVSTGTLSKSSPASQSREQNVVVFGITETTDWRKKLSLVLNFVTGREVAVQDAYRIGRSASVKSRPILVKLHSVWDRRLILSNSRELASCTDYMRDVFIHADEPLEERRKTTMKRLIKKAERGDRSTETSDDGDKLFIDGVLVFTLRDGFVRRNNSATASVSSHNDDNGC